MTQRPFFSPEAEWVADMIGFRLRPPSLLDELPRNGDDVFFASTSSVSPTISGLATRDTAFPWVLVDGINREIRVDESVSLDGVLVRSLWFNVAMLGLLQQGGLLIHAAGAELQGHGLLILGVSGAGKSTLSALLEAAFPESVMCDERIALLPEEGTDESTWRMMGSPWESSAGIARRKKTPLSALIFLEQAPVCEIHPLPASEALQQILPLVSIDWKEQSLSDRGVAALDSLLASVPAFVYRFTKEPEAAHYLNRWATSRD